MKIAVVSLFTQEIVELAQYTLLNHKAYCDKHGYDYIVYQGRFSKRHPAWDKIKAVQEILPNYDYVLWIDTDAIFIDFNQKLENFIIYPEKYNGYFCKDPTNGIYANTGVFLLKNCQWSVDLLEQTWNATSPRLYDTYSKHAYNDWPFEQGPMCEILKKDTQHYIIPDYVLNSHEVFVHKKTVVVHYMGSRHTEEIFQGVIEKVKSQNKKNEVQSGTVPIRVLPPLDAFLSETIYKQSIDVIYDKIQAKLDFKISRDNLLCFDYILPPNTHLNHQFKINEKISTFDSSPSGCLQVPDEFKLYHSYEWFGKTDFKLVGEFKI